MEDIEEVGESGEGGRVASDSIRMLEKANYIYTVNIIQSSTRDSECVQSFFRSGRLLATFTREQDITDGTPYPSLRHASVSREGKKQRERHLPQYFLALE